MAAHSVIEYVRREMSALRNPENARHMTACMKHVQSFYGIKTGDWQALFKEGIAKHPGLNRDDYEYVVRSLWQGPYREARCLALQNERALSGLNKREALKRIRKNQPIG